MGNTDFLDILQIDVVWEETKNGRIISAKAQGSWVMSLSKWLGQVQDEKSD